ncbi:sulfurtransferase [bacterium]|nr:sulfurtransferase [bacterium]
MGESAVSASASSESFAGAISERGYANPEVLVSTEWVQEHLDDPTVRIVESNEDQLLYRSGHIPNAVEIDWVRDLNDPVVRDYVGQEAFSALLSRSQITPDTTVVFYGDKSNWWACYAFWVFQLYGHSNAVVMDGGRKKWELEGRSLTRELPKLSPTLSPTHYPAPPRDDVTYRAFRDEVLQHCTDGGALVDVRSEQEFSGERLHMPDYPNEGALRGGHIPGAKSIPWARALSPEDGSFLPATELKQIYGEEHGLSPDEATIAYCRIGERSSLTWFVLRYLLGFSRVKNYDGSWTEWGNLVGVPIEKDVQ